MNLRLISTIRCYNYGAHEKRSHTPTVLIQQGGGRGRSSAGVAMGMAAFAEFGAAGAAERGSDREVHRRVSAPSLLVDLFVVAGECQRSTLSALPSGLGCFRFRVAVPGLPDASELSNGGV